MEGRNRSGSHSGGVVKNRSSSGCLILKKKSDGVSGVRSCKSSKLHESKKEKKRARLNDGDALSSEEELLELYPKGGIRGMKQLTGASLVYEDNDFEDKGFNRNGLMPKRSKLDIYDFDEYDDLSDVEMLRMNHYHERGVGVEERRFSGAMPGKKNGSGLGLESGSSKGDIIYKRRNSFHAGSSIEKIKSGDLYSGKRRFELRSELPVAMGKEAFGGSDDAIRLQGKNGVLKVRVKHKEDISEQLSHNYIQVKGTNVASRSQELTSKNICIRRPSPYQENNLSKKPMTVDRIVKNQRRKREPLSAESSEESDEEAEDSDLPPKLQINSVQVHQSAKRGNRGSTQAPQKAQSVKLKEGIVKRGSGTEKQLLREKIRSMLVTAGWTIDYRPRRGRDYFDAVYVNPTGTAYWSIIKAYDALQKQLEEEGNPMKPSVESSSFAPISEDVLSKLTRQTRKKIEKELKRKKREEAGGKRKKEFVSGNFDEDESDTDSGGSGRHDDKLSSFMKRSGKSLKGASKESYRDGSNLNSEMQERGEKLSLSNRFIHARKSKKMGRCMLLVRNSGKLLDSDSDGFVPYTGKRNLLSWLIDSGTVKLSEKVHYMNRRCTRVMLEGWITREGIHCGCCSKILTVSKFEIHAASKLRQPYQNIYTSSGASLMQCQVDAWNGQEESLRNGYNKIDVNGDDPNDDTCAICGDGGNLICCDSCPSTFHQNCLGIEMLPAGDWHCPHCSCKFCGLADMSVTMGNDRIQDTVLTCSLCEGKYHCSCAKEMEGTPINSNSSPFCGKTCQELSEGLQQLLGVKHELEAGLFWSLIHRTELGSDTSVRGFPQRVEWNSKLAVALTVMDECFLPIIDRRSGINMIHSVLYNSGSNITRLNYSGFYTAILEKGDEIVSAASIRIRGTDFAEMPFIGTRHIYRRQGMCRRLFSAIESALRSLKVEKLIIPAISELMDTWTTVFGFCTLEESDKHGAKIGNMLVFPGTDMLQKKLLDLDNFKRGLAGADSFENNLNASLAMPGLRTKSALDSSPEPPSAAAEPQNEVMKETVTDFGCRDMVSTDGSSLHDASANHCGGIKPPFPAGNENTDEPVSDFNYKDVICTNESNLHSSSADYVRGVEALPSENEEMKEKSDTNFGYEDMICTDGNSFHGAADYCEVKMPSLTENDEIKDESVTDFCSEDMFVADGNSLLVASTDCEEVKPPSPTEIREKSVFGCCKEPKPSLLTKNKENKDNVFTDFGSQDMVSPKEKTRHGAYADCCEEGKPSLPTGSSCDCNDDKFIVNDETKDTSIYDFGSGGKVFPNEKFANIASVDCCKEDDPSLHAASTAVSGEVEPLVSNEGSSGSTSYELQLLKKSDVGVKADASTGPCEIGCFLDDAARHNIKASFDYKLTQGASMALIESGSSPADGMLVATPGYGMLDGLHMNDSETPRHGILSSKDEAAFCRKDLSLLESSHVDLEMKPLVENTIHHPLEVEVDNSHIVSAEIDGCSGSQSLHVSDCIIDSAHESMIHVSGNDTICSQIIEEMPLDDNAYRLEQNESHTTVVIEKQQLHSFGVTTEPSLEGEVKHVEVANVFQNSSSSYDVSIVNTPNSEDLPCTYGDGVIGVLGLLPASELDDQGTM